MLTNVTGNFADLAVELGGEGAKTTVPVPEHGTVMLTGIFFGTKKLVKLRSARAISCHAATARDAVPVLSRVRQETIGGTRGKRGEDNLLKQ